MDNEHIDNYIHSLVFRPNGMSGSFADSLMVKGSNFQLAIGTPPAQKLSTSEYPKSLLRPFGAQRLDFLDLLAYREGSKKLSFFWHRTKT